MAIRDKLQKKLGKAFSGKLADAVNSFTGSYVVQNGWDPVTETGGVTTVNYTGRGVMDNYSLDRVDNVNILTGDMLLIALKNEVTGTPQIDHTITTSDLAKGSQQAYKVITVEVDPAAAHYEIQLRRV